MKLTITAEKLKAALDVARIAASTRSQYSQITTFVLLEADGGLLTISGTDLESRSWHAVGAEIEESGGVALSPKAIDDFLGAVGGDDVVTLTAGPTHKTELVSGTTRVRMAGMDPEEFPVCPDFADASTDLTLGAADVAQLIASVAFAATGDDSRPALSGVLVRAAGGTLTMVAADGFRLAMRSMPFDGPDLNVIAAARHLTRAASVLARATSARLVVDQRASMLLIDSEAGSFAIRLIDGDFPDVNRIIPKDAPVVVTLARADLRRAANLIRNTMTEVTEKGKTFKTQMARLSVTADAIKVRATGTDGDREAETIIAATRERGDDLAITYNGAYFRDAVEAIDTDRVTLELVGPASPSIMRPAGERNGYLHVLMPMHDARVKS